MTDRPPDTRAEIDTLLRTLLPDDLPCGVEARLDDRVERFLHDRRQRTRGPLAALIDRLAPRRPWLYAWVTGRSLPAAASVALVVCGFVLHAVAGHSLFAASVARVSAPAALWAAVGRATSMRCTGAAQDDLRTPAEFAERVYRSWVLVGSTTDATGTSLILTFRAPGDGARYDLVVERQSMLPRRVVKTLLDAGSRPSGGVAGYDAGCNWETSASGIVPGERTYGHR